MLALFTFYALPSVGKSKDAVVHCKTLYCYTYYCLLWKLPTISWYLVISIIHLDVVTFRYIIYIVYIVYIEVIVTFTDSIPGVGGSKNDDDDVSKEDQIEQERLRQEAIKQAEKERRDKYKKQEEEREVLRQGIREKVRTNSKMVLSRFGSNKSGQVVSVLTLYFDDPSSNPAEVYSFFCKISVWKEQK